MGDIVGVVALVVGAVAAFTASEVARELEWRADRLSEAPRE